MVTEQSVVDVLIGRVQVVQHHVCVTRMTSRKDYHLEVLRKVFDYLLSIGSNVYASFNDLPSRKSNRQLHVVRRRQSIVAVNQSLIQVEHHSFLA